MFSCSEFITGASPSTFSPFSFFFHFFLPTKRHSICNWRHKNNVWFYQRLRSWQLQRILTLNGSHLCLLQRFVCTVIIEHENARKWKRKTKDESGKKKKMYRSLHQQRSALTRYRVQNHIGRTSVFNQFTYGNVVGRARAHSNHHLIPCIAPIFCPKLDEAARTSIHGVYDATGSIIIIIPLLVRKNWRNFF